MAHRSFAIGDIHGDLAALRCLLGRLPTLDAQDTLIFLGDYVDRGPDSAEVVDLLRVELPRSTPARVVCLRGNHEDAWLRVIRDGWPEFVIPRGNGCRACAESWFRRLPEPLDKQEAMVQLFSGAFFPAEVVAWFESLPHWYEDQHALYVHAGLAEQQGRWLHPREVSPASKLLWLRSRRFFTQYQGKTVVCGHTATRTLPPELDSYTPEAMCA